MPTLTVPMTRPGYSDWRMLEDIQAIHYEEPCPFDNFDATRQVADALSIRSRWASRKSSQWRFQWMIRNRVADIVQPDLFYYGGLVRSRRVARMAEVCDLAPTVHLSGGFGFVYSLHFASCTPGSVLGRSTRKASRPTASGSIRRCASLMAR